MRQSENMVCAIRMKDDINMGISRSPDLEYEKNAYSQQYHGRPGQRSLLVKLKGVDLPKFSRENYNFKAA